MSGNSHGQLFKVTTYGESHGDAIGCIIDGCPPNLKIDIADIQRDLDRRKPGKTRHTSQRRESDTVKILSGVFNENCKFGSPKLTFIGPLMLSLDRMYLISLGCG